MGSSPISTRVLLTGTAGLLGTATANRLVATGHDVLAVRRDEAEERPGVRWVLADLEDPDSLAGVGGVDAIVHLAARIPLGTDDEAVARANERIDSAVLAYAARSEAPVVFASSGAVYGSTTGVRSEDGPLDAHTPYLEGKVRTERQGAERQAAGGPPFTSLRINAPYGPRQRARTVLQLFVARALDGGPITFHGDGTREQDFTWADDVADACVAAIDGPGGVFNIATGTATTMAGLAALVAERAGLGPEAVSASGHPDPQEGQRARFDVSRAARDLGWSARTPLAEGIDRLLVAAGA